MIKEKHGIFCLKCKTILISLSQHDWKACRCGNYVDGGDAYFRCGGEIKDMQNITVTFGKKLIEEIEEFNEKNG